MYFKLFGLELFIERTEFFYKRLLGFLHDAPGEAEALLFGRWHVVCSW